MSIQVTPAQYIQTETDWNLDNKINFSKSRFEAIFQSTNEKVLFQIIIILSATKHRCCILVGALLQRERNMTESSLLPHLSIISKSFSNSFPGFLLTSGIELVKLELFWWRAERCFVPNGLACFGSELIDWKIGMKNIHKITNNASKISARSIHLPPT